MARHARVQSEGAHYHVYAHGDGNESILANDTDKRYFLSYLSEGLIRFGIRCHAFCLMDTHYHFILETPTCNLSEMMHFLGSSFGSRLSNKGWAGHVFSSRFCSKMINTDEYLIVLSKYIHNNPVKAGILREPAAYKWSSYRFYAVSKLRPQWLWTETIMEFFGPEPCNRRNYQEFVESDSLQPGFGGTDRNTSPRLLLFHEKLLSSPPNLDPNSILDLYAHPLEIKDLLDVVCSHYGIENLAEDSNLSRNSIRRIRRLFVYLARMHTSASFASIGSMMGNVTSQAAAQQYDTISRHLSDSNNKESEVHVDLRRLQEKLGLD